MNYFTKAGTLSVCMATTLFSVTSYAEEKAKPGFHPSLVAYYISDDNIFRQATSKVSDSILTISPELLLVKAKGKHRFTAKYNGNFASYGKNSSENYTDHFINLGGMFDFSRKFQANLEADFNQNHESRDSAGFIPSAPTTKPNQWSENKMLAGFTYGRRIAKVQFEMDMSMNNMDYTNNNQDYRDRKSNALSTRLFYNIGPKSSVYLESKTNTIDYTNSGVRNLDSEETFNHLGFRWDVTSKTTGQLKFGSFTKKFDSAAESDGSGSSYEANILWKPKTYSHLTFAFSQAPQESTTADSFFTTSLMSVNWKHNVSSKLGLNLGYASGTDDYSGTRKDTLSNMSLGLSYKIRRKIELGMNMTTTKRDSSFDAADFNDGVFMLTAKWIKR